MYEFNDTKASYPKEAVLHRLYELQADRWPDRIAISMGESALTYEQLNARANALAGVLRDRGVKPNQIVGILCSRSENMVISILAVLKAGGAYMPIDPQYPKERIKFMIEDSGSVLCIVEDAALAPVGTSVPTVNLEDREVRLELGVQSASNLEAVNKPEDLAYIIYTSGSTGTPKGVMIEHRNVVRLLFNDRNLFDFNEHDVWTLFHSFCFDFSVWEMYGALLNGGKLVIVPEAAAREPQRFLELLRKEGVTILNQTPTAFYQLAKLETGQPYPADLRVRHVIFGGEALLPIQLAAWKKKYPNIKLINMYGITETTVHVTYKEIGLSEIEGRISNIGKPIPTLQIYLLNEDSELVPIGVEGEIYVGGEGLARGYVNRPELTQERFVPHPFEPGQRLYRTGDSARWHAHGELEYLGRIDHQVKIRGYRIELGEITTRLLHCAGVEDAVVTVKKDSFEEDMLCAYFVSEQKISGSELREQLSRHLPQYMLPSHYIQIKSIPMTLNNKVDVKSLPAPGEHVQPADDSNLVMPSNEMEQRMLDIWKLLLNHSNIGVTSNYFGCGGDSIRAIELISRCNRELGLHLEIVDLYMHPTIQGLLENCSAPGLTHDIQQEIRGDLERQRQEWLDNPDYRGMLPPQVEDMFPMSDIQQGMVYHYMKHEGSGVYHDQFVYRTPGRRLSAEKLREAIALISSRHPMLRTGFNLTDFPVPVQFVCSQMEYPLDEVALANEGDDGLIELEIRAYLERDRKRPFRIEKAPLWRIVLFHSESETYLCWIFHHAILDGWSVAAFISELFNLYKDLKGEEVSA